MGKGGGAVAPFLSLLAACRRILHSFCRQSQLAKTQPHAHARVTTFHFSGHFLGEGEKKKTTVVSAPKQQQQSDGGTTTSSCVVVIHAPRHGGHGVQQRLAQLRLGVGLGAGSTPAVPTSVRGSSALRHGGVASGPPTPSRKSRIEVGPPPRRAHACRRWQGRSFKGGERGGGCSLYDITTIRQCSARP